MDDFAGNTDAIKVGALNMGVREYLADRVEIELNDLVENLMDEMRVNMTQKQKDAYYTRLVKNLTIVVKDGVLRIDVKE